MCKAFPSIDWTKATWKVKQPAALWAEARYAHAAYPGSPIGVMWDSNGDPGNGVPFYFAYVGTIPNYVGEPSAGATVGFDIYLSQFIYHMRAGEFVSRYDGDCQWHAKTRERLCPNGYGLLFIQKPDVGWVVNKDIFADASVDWQDVRAQAFPLSDPILGPFEFVSNAYSPGALFQTWRKVLKPAECEFLPSIQQRGFPVEHDYHIENGLLSRLESARQLIDSPPSQSWFYRPTAMDLAVEFSLTGGIEFGVDGNPDSPHYGAFQIYTGAVFHKLTTTTITINSTDFHIYRQGFIYEIRSAVLNWIIYRGLFVPGDESPSEFSARVASEINLNGGYDDEYGFLSFSQSAVAVGNTVTVKVQARGETSTNLDVGAIIDPLPVDEADGKYSVSQTATRWTDEAPWQLVDRPAVVAEFGVVNRFERTDDNDTLPAWIELELIPL